jgi:prepilin-type N-terminal cleavage/methylation domain-containing protein
MKTLQNKGFTLVELIVVITILAILGTIAFISLQGYSTDAKNSKVTSDLKTISTALEAKRTQTSETLDAFLAGAHITANEVAGDT